MKVAIINFSSSGLYHYAACLAGALAERSTTRVLFITSQFNNLSIIPPHRNLTVVAQAAPHRLPQFLAWLANPAEQLRFYRSITEFQPDVIHITDSHAIYVPHQWWLKRYPILFTQHDPISHAGDVYRLSSGLIHRTQQRLAGRIVVHGNKIRDSLAAQGIDRRHIAVIPHGDYSFYLKWRRPDAIPVPKSVLFFGRIVDYKGLDLLLHSAGALQKEGVPITLIIAGAGKLTKYEPLLRQIKHKIIDNRTIPEAEVMKYFQMATMVVLPYREASQSGIISIAMPAGLPIIATRVGALPEVLQNEVSGLLVEPGSVPALTGAIRRILENPDLGQRLARQAQETARARLSWPNIAASYQQQYELLV
jgi:glycosyltransferase involved in cell wall biosynthesis